MKIYIISIVCSKVFNASQAWPLLFEPFMIRRLFVGAGAGGRVFLPKLIFVMMVIVVLLAIAMDPGYKYEALDIFQLI